MGLGNWFKGRDAAAVPVKRPDEMITVYDERGRELQIRRAAWVESVLVPGLRRAWDDPAQLSAEIVRALHDDFAEQLRQAVERLLVLDRDSERALLLAAIVRMECDALDLAEETLDRCRNKHGISAMTLTNLAKVYDRRGDKEKAKTTLRQSLELDPNQDALLWWATMAQEQQGAPAFESALEEIARVPNAWRPHLWIAREKLKRGEKSAALALYEEVLATSAERSDVLMMITGDLGTAGMLDELVRLTAPHYKAETHGPQAGMNIARAFKELGRTDEARALVRRLQAMNWPPFASALAALEAEIVAMSLPKTTDIAPAIGIYTVERPLWTHGLFEPDWLFRQADANEPTVCLVTFANAMLRDNAPHVQLSESLGRLTRSLPLYLTESLSLRLPLRTKALMFVSQGHGPAVFGQVMNPSVIEAHLPGSDGRCVVVTGTLVADGVQIIIWEVGARGGADELRVSCPPTDVGSLVAATEKAVVDNLERRGLASGVRPPALYPQPSKAEILGGYALALDQLFYQWLAADGLIPATSLWNERGFFESYFGVVDAWANAPESARLLAVGGAVAAAKYGSSVAGPYRAMVLRWLDEATPGSLLFRLAPAVLAQFGETERFGQALAKLPRLADDAYMAWLERVTLASAKQPPLISP